MSAGLAAFSDYLTTYLKPEQIAEVVSAYAFPGMPTKGSSAATATPTSPTLLPSPISWPACTWTIKA